MTMSSNAVESAPRPRRPTPAELAAAHGKTIPDVIAGDLDVLFCGINPGLYSAATGHHFARPGNRFWPALHAGGFTPRRLAPREERELLTYGCGITNLVARGTASAAELTRDELRAGRRRLERKVRRYRPRWLAVVGITAYRTAFDRLAATLGEQPDRIGDTRIWVLPNPSGLNAHHRPADFARAFRALRDHVPHHEATKRTKGAASVVRRLGDSPRRGHEAHEGKRRARRERMPRKGRR